jgi:hypothetical protein
MDLLNEPQKLDVNFERHPVIPLPHPDWVDQNPEEAQAYFESRTKAIYLEQVDPLLHGSEPGIWKVVDALFGFECFDKAFEEEIKERFGEDKDWEWWAAAMRRVLGFPAPVSVVLINGGNRGGKSQYAAKRTVQRIYRKPKQTVWALHADHPMSVQYQQSLVNEHMPIEKRSAKIIEGRPEYISHKEATGFTNNKFITHHGSTCVFKYYSADMSSTIEGGECDFIWNDELVPPDWVDTERLRVATRNGKILITFTPVEGYTETVRMFQEGAKTTRESIAFLCPDDAGEPLEHMALGFDNPEQHAYAKTYGPNSIPEDVHAWIEGGSGQPEVPAGRKFKMAPRVMRCIGQSRGGKMEYNAAVVFFHSSDNPYGNPEGVLKMVAGKSMDFIKERFYGVANKTMTTRFPRFNEDVHVIPADKIPNEGTDYMICDPSNGRNFTFTWWRKVGNRDYLMREWPGNYPIETANIGLPGPWAEVDGKRKDGRKGPAQSPFGFSLLEYKQEIARLEKWKVDYTATPDPRDWEPSGEEGEQNVIERYIDARPANTASVTAEGSWTLLEELQDINFEFIPVILGPAGSLSSSVPQSAIHLINDALSYDESKPIGFTNSPRLYICEECHNSIFALKIWTGEDGNKGACKDFIDHIRYYYAQDLDDVSKEGVYGSSGGVTY